MIGEKIRQIRKSKRITQRELSIKTGISTSYIQQLEYKTKENPSLEKLILIAKALDINIHELTEEYAEASCDQSIILSEPIEEIMDERSSEEIIKEDIERIIIKFSDTVGNVELEEEEVYSLVNDCYKYIEFLFYMRKR